MPENPSPIDRADERLWQLASRFGILRWIVLAVLVADVGLVTYRGGDGLQLLPGMVGLAVCAMLVWNRPLPATYAGAAVLLISTLLMRSFGGDPYSSLLANITFSECVSGVLLLFGCVRQHRAWHTWVAAVVLVAATVTAVLVRVDFDRQRPTELVYTALIGMVFVVACTVGGVYTRDAGSRFPPRPAGRFGRFMEGQWLIAVALLGPLSLEFMGTINDKHTAFFLYGASALAAVATLFARHRPVISVTALALAITAVAVVKQFTDRGDYALGGVTPTIVAAGAAMVIVQVRRFPLRPVALGITVLSVVVACSVIFDPRLPSSGVRVNAALATLVLGMSIAVGLYLRSRDSERIRTVHTAVADAQTMERMALARELHDVVAHHVTGIVVQAQAARMVAENDPQAAYAAMGRIENAGTEALAAMRRLVGSMRGEAPAGSTEFSEQATTDLAADLRTLVNGGSHGVSTTLSVDVPPDLPQEVARSALRIVQEALTNVGKHAVGASGATVTVDVSYSELHIAVADNGIAGSPKAPGGAGGYGLIGMRERVDLLGGRLIAEPGPVSGWLVEVWLPYDEPAEGEP